MSNETIDGCAGKIKLPASLKESIDTGPKDNPAYRNHVIGKGINLIANPQFEFVPYDIEEITNNEALQIMGHAADLLENILVDKGTTIAEGYLEGMMTYDLRKVYIDARHKTAYGHNVTDVDFMLGFDHRLVNRNNVDLIVIDNAALDRVDFFVYLDQLLRYQNQTNEPFNGVQFVIAGSRYDYPVTPEGFHDQKLWNELDYDETRRDRLENLHVGLHNSYYELWTLAGFTVFA